MGGSGSTRRVSFEADENDNITVVKGIRLSDNVINRMREPTSVTRPQTPSPPAPPQAKFPAEQPVAAGYTVNEEELRRKIAEELALEQARRESATQKRLDHGILMQEEIGKVLERERNASTEQLTRAILREKAATEDERLKAKTFARKLEEKERDLKRQDEYYKEQLARLEERSAQFYKVTTDQYQEAANTVEARFKKYESHPVCADLQAQVLQCYQKNPQQTLSCSVLASQYMQCVNNAKQKAIHSMHLVDCWCSLYIPHWDYAYNSKKLKKKIQVQQINVIKVYYHFMGGIDIAAESIGHQSVEGNDNLV